jgi:hypothetical protein
VMTVPAPVVPVTVGTLVFAGAPAPDGTTVFDVAEAEPDAFVAVTTQVMLCPISPLTVV